MPSFRWSAITPAGEVMHGVTEAADCASVVDRLQRQGQAVLRAEPADGRWRLGDLLQIELGGRRGLDRTTLGEVTRELARRAAPCRRRSTGWPGCASAASPRACARR